MIYDGAKNIVLVMKDGNKTFMLPLKEDKTECGNTNNCFGIRVMLSSTKEFLREGNKVHYCFVSIPKGLGVEVKREYIPMEVGKMLF